MAARSGPRPTARDPCRRRPSYTVAASVPDYAPSALELFLHTLTTEPQRTGNACFIGASVERPAMSAAAKFDLSDRKTPHNGPIAQYY